MHKMQRAADATSLRRRPSQRDPVTSAANSDDHLTVHHSRETISRVDATVDPAKPTLKCSNHLTGTPLTQ
jgi:hypothetical protein